MNAAHVGTLKSPPYLVHSEKAVLGAVLTDPSLFGEVREIVRDSTAFFKDQHSAIYEMLVELDEQHDAIDLEMIMKAARQRGLVSDAAGTSAIDTLVAVAVPKAAALEHAQQIRDKALMRELIDAFSEILYDASKSSDGFLDVVARAQEKLKTLAAKGEATPPPPPPAPQPPRRRAREGRRQ
jgi:replicative DNA helicase